MYDWLKPALASAYIRAGLVKASERKTTSGCSSRTSPMSQRQKAIGLVWGLSTRKTRTPRATQVRTTSRSASHRPRQSGLSKLTL